MKKSFMLVGSSVMVIAVLIAAVAFSNQKNDIPANHLEVVLRDIGHELLLSAKDSSSRVLPVKKINEHTYQISFQNEVGFISDSLINLVQRTFQKNALAKDYIVNLRNCKQNETVFAFEINSHTGDLTPCRGRTLEVGCYVIEIDLLKKEQFNFFWLLLLIPLSVLGFYVNNTFRKKVEKEENEDKDEQESISGNNDYIPLGSFQFYTADHVLKREHTTIPLSEKETKALKIFAENVNQIVAREKLMKEIWEDEGIVVISRNVDVLVSKLRKKLSDDNSLKFINVHGKGYKFIIE
ncbi:winged helix-turn-helix domain-containing protein [Ferruginibacter paludis]|uniref:winged helix-turn-helix domain-containing protein n=1 Tax=Ferruginibacter paludis TaxID=1310417 RepID=UPI0025B2EC70|nr:winged helix-turn-helix domain-containing protein [Ferruginibacter paludis]MDN3654517.1 winged helix-turn-helix domain-containing protein [Ferruginibacter paludis]